MRLIKTAMAGSWTPEWLWLGPDWADINDRETSSVGFLPGPALGADARRGVEGESWE